MHFNPHHPRGWRLPSSKCYLVVQRFQSTPPSRVATLTGQRQIQCQPFQSTPPSRVATWINLPSFPADIEFQSTPPSRVATAGRSTIACQIFYFNPHHPRGWRRRSPAHQDILRKDFNPHHPRGWRRLKRFLRGGLSCISIHTTLAGGDLKHRLTTYRYPTFQSTPPSRVATIWSCVWF